MGFSRFWGESSTAAVNSRKSVVGFWIDMMDLDVL